MLRFRETPSTAVFCPNSHAERVFFFRAGRLSESLLIQACLLECAIRSERSRPLMGVGRGCRYLCGAMHVLRALMRVYAQLPLHAAPTNQTISPRKNPSAGSGTHFLGRSERLIGATE